MRIRLLVSSVDEGHATLVFITGLERGYIGAPVLQFVYRSLLRWDFYIGIFQM